MIFHTQASLSENDIELSLKNVTKDGYISQIMVNLTMSPILISSIFLIFFWRNIYYKADLNFIDLIALKIRFNKKLNF